jgi:hypothetical protein
MAGDAMDPVRRAFTPDLRPFVERVVRWFGAERLLFGSDWPVCLLAGSYGDIVTGLDAALPAMSRPNEFSCTAVTQSGCTASHARPADSRRRSRPRWTAEDRSLAPSLV